MGVWRERVWGGRGRVCMGRVGEGGGVGRGGETGGGVERGGGGKGSKRGTVLIAETLKKNYLWS